MRLDSRSRLLPQPVPRPPALGALAVVALFSGAAWAAISSVTGDGEKIDPADVRVGRTESSENIRGIGALGMQSLALYYQTEESKEGARAFREKRKPDFRKYV